MSNTLLSLPTQQLLRKFGMGNHKPGSGSAAAFQGLLSAELVRTVISLTNEPKPRRSKYEPWLPDLLKIDSEIRNRITPEMETLFQQDAIQFDKHIKLLKKRDAETDPYKQSAIDKLALEELVISTEIPLKIARLCIELGDYAAFVFEHGFKSASGDAAVALNGATASVAGCLSIVDLNLSKFGCNDWTVRIRTEAEELASANENLVLRGVAQTQNFRNVCRTKSLKVATSEFTSGSWEDVKISDKAIETLAKQLQNVLWEYRDLVWQEEIPGSPIDVLSPKIAIEKILGYEFKQASIGENGMAGLIDKNKKLVIISRDFRKDVQNFTAAHELGHALLHKEIVLHRDRALDGSNPENRDYREVQANRFATFFLMPTKQIKSVFQEIFQTEKFTITDNSVFALGEGRVSDFRKKVKNERGLARFIASYNGSSFRSLAEIFNVSVTAMAIRLEELSLIELR